MRRKQKTVEDCKAGTTGCSCDGTVEPKSSKKAQSIVTPEAVEKNGDLLDKILHRNNLNVAYKRVKGNKGAAGVDGMTVDKMLSHLKEHREEFIASIRGGWYKPQPVRRVEIPKLDSGVRMLGVPTVIDRMIQQAIAQVLEPIFEPTFSESSYGFRPNKNAHQAITKAKEYYDEGYTHVVDIDLAKYFDTVNHDILLGMVNKQVKDKAVMKLIRKFLKSGVLADGLVSATEEGTPQGGNLSPLLSNIYLTEFDRMLESRGHKFVRYADDCNIYVKSSRAAGRVMESCVKFLEGKLKLKVNQEKSQTGSPMRLKFLGFSLCRIGERTRIRPHQKTLERFKSKIKELTGRRQGKSIEAILERLQRYTTGWLGYYAIANMKTKIQALNEWIRRRIRQIYWKQWKVNKARHDNLVRLGKSSAQAWQWANSRLGYWRIAGSWILTTTLTNMCLESEGYDNIAKRYEALHLNY
jgi:group II intron reverse transcriptase/maturase